MSTPFRQLHHICLVVHDIEASKTFYESIGVGPWQQYPSLSQYTNLHVPNADAFRQLKYLYVDLENVQIQLCEPPQLDCPQRRFLDSRGEGVFHIGFESNLDAGVAEAESAGLTTLMSGRRDNGTGFTYFDTLDDTGFVWMIRQTKPVDA
jgi:methylmalonyl-CoA/ethylmalonyl-CoA epimerase